MFQTLPQENAVILQPQEPPSHAMIWLHGLGADGFDFVEIMEQLDFGGHSMLGIFPHAPVQAVTINGGMQMRAWYDIRTTDLLNDVDMSGIGVASEQIHHWIEQCVQQGIPAENIFLIGFSQGGVIAQHAGLTTQHRLGGIGVWSSYCPNVEQLAMNKTVPMIMMHGELDPVVPIEAAIISKETLEKNGYSIDWYTYPMQHSVCMEQVDAFQAWLHQRLKR